MGAEGGCAIAVESALGGRSGLNGLRVRELYQKRVQFRGEPLPHNDISRTSRGKRPRKAVRTSVPSAYKHDSEL